MPQIKLADVRDLLLKTAETLRRMNAERVVMRDKLAASENRQRAETILAEAEQRGLDMSSVVGAAATKEAQVDALLKRGNLRELQGAVKLAARNYGVAELGGDPNQQHGDEKPMLASEADLIAGIMEP